MRVLVSVAFPSRDSKLLEERCEKERKSLHHVGIEFDSPILASESQ